MTSTTASAIRPSLRDNRNLSGSPHTPSRFISSTYSSPGSSFRQEEDAIILQLTSRQLSAGFEGESGPQCTITFGPENSRRIGDYRAWLPDYKRSDIKVEDAARANELWRNDLSDVDLGLVEDKLERAVREVYNKYLLTDAGTARLILGLPSIVPIPIISSLLTTLFERWKYTTITLLPAPTMCIVAAGVRSGLVVDVGWEETVVTPVYEYREMANCRSTRGMKMLTIRMADKLQSVASQHTSTDGQPLRLDFDFIEDFIARTGFSNSDGGGSTAEAVDGVSALSIDAASNNTAGDISVEWPSQTASQTIRIPRSEIARVVDDCFFDHQHGQCHDDHEKTLEQILFRCLLDLPSDVRGVCLPKIMFTGSGAAIPGLRQRVLSKTQALVDKYGWTPVRGQHVKSTRRGLSEIAQGRAPPVDARHNVSLPVGKDYVEDKVRKQRPKEMEAGAQSSLRCIESLGAWAGASLLASLKVKSVVEIERERFLSHGVSGASREAETSVVPQRTSSFAVGVSKGGDRSSWTLGCWG